MKEIIKTTLILSWIFGGLLPVSGQKNKEPEITLEQVVNKCKGLSRDKRVTVKVARFSVSAKSAQAHYTFGDELATMLTSALQQTNCFRVLETNKNLADATSEMAFGQDGFTSGGSPQAGNMLGAQLIITGEITDFSEGKSSTSVAGMDFGKNQATVGFTLKVLNPQTGELLFSKDVNMKGTSSGFKGFSIGTFKTFGTTENRAVQDATQKAIIKSVEILADEKDNMDIPEPLKPVELKRYNAQNCLLLKKGSPKVIILVTEATTAGTARDYSYADLERREREMELREREADIELGKELIGAIFGKKKNNAKAEEPPTSKQTSATAEFKSVVIEQSTTETELTRHFVEAGFRVVDPKVYGKMNEIANMGDDLASMAALGLKMGANIIITGQAISERTNAQGGMTASRARLEIKVIDTSDGSILATNTVAGGGIDVSEVIANKTALQNASLTMSQYLMDRLCGMNIQVASGAAQSSAKSSNSETLTEIELENVTFAQLRTIETQLKANSKIKEVKKSLTGKTGRIELYHITTADQIADILSNIKTVKIEIVGLQDDKIEASVR